MHWTVQRNEGTESRFAKRKPAEPVPSMKEDEIELWANTRIARARDKINQTKHMVATQPP
eukprot:6198470-Pleurochrysis_carterae.AAC.2